jgi:hypothetical protein
MAAASGAFGVTLQDAFDASQLAVNTGSDSFVMTLHTNTFTPNFDTHDLYADLTNEITGTGYTANTKALTTVTFVAASGFLKFDADDTAWTGATFSAVRQRVVNDTTLTGDALLLCTDLGTDYAVTAGTFTIAESANGLLRVDYIV